MTKTGDGIESECPGVKRGRDGIKSECHGMKGTGDGGGCEEGVHAIGCRGREMVLGTKELFSF
jgi:hypothetical protein